MIVILQCGFKWIIALCLTSYQERIILVKILWGIEAVTINWTNVIVEVSSGLESLSYH